MPCLFPHSCRATLITFHAIPILSVHTVVRSTLFQPTFLSDYSPFLMCNWSLNVRYLPIWFRNLLSDDSVICSPLPHLHQCLVSFLLNFFQDFFFFWWCASFDPQFWSPLLLLHNDKSVSLSIFTISTQSLDDVPDLNPLLLLNVIHHTTPQYPVFYDATFSLDILRSSVWQFFWLLGCLFTVQWAVSKIVFISTSVSSVMILFFVATFARLCQVWNAQCRFSV